MERACLEKLPDDRVLERVHALVARSNELTAELLAYMAEAERRGLHLREATGSFFAYCVERLHMSEAAAGKRITAARTARRFPLALEMIARGEIHLSGLNLLAPHLSEENHAELLARARHLSKRAIEKLVAEIAPRPDLPSRVVALPRRVQPEQAEPAAAAAQGTAESHAPGRAASAVAPAPALVAPLSPRRYQIRVTVDEATHAALCQLQDLHSHQVPDRDPAVIISLALDLLLERTLARKTGATERPRAQKPPANRTRHIPAAVRRQVWQRDGGQCAFVDGEGRRCSSTRFLEFHHVKNWARGAKHEVGQIELRCRGHNQYQAVLDYGADFIARRRGAEEPRRPYGLHAPVRVGTRRQVWRHSMES
jgi:5-methylcytosine-specific restriction endonuclease McrA